MPGLNPTRVTLGNGVTVIAKSNTTTPAVSTLVGVVFTVGTPPCCA